MRKCAGSFLSAAAVVAAALLSVALPALAQSDPCYRPGPGGIPSYGAKPNAASQDRTKCDGCGAPSLCMLITYGYWVDCAKPLGEMSCTVCVAYVLWKQAGDGSWWEYDDWDNGAGDTCIQGCGKDSKNAYDTVALNICCAPGNYSFETDTKNSGCYGNGQVVTEQATFDFGP